jgi:hypothetical protein
MLTKWFESRTSRALKDRPFRPCLESLEERNAPSGGPGPDHDHGPPPPHHPPGVPVGVNNSISVAAGNGNHGSFNNSTITGSFNTTINNTNTVTVNLTMGQTAAVTGLLGISNFLSSALSNPNLGALLSDEIALAVDQYLSTAVPSVASALSSDITTLTSAIASNPLSSTPFGHLIGTIAHDTTVDALTSAAAP